LKRWKSRLDSAPVNFYKQIIWWGAAILFFISRLNFAQVAPDQSPSPRPEKLEVETIATLTLDQRRQLLSALTPEEREKFAEQFRKLPPGGPSNGKINALSMAWAGVDPVRAIENAKKFPTADARRVAIEAVCFGVKPEAGKVIAQSVKDLREDALPSEERERFLGMAIVKWSQADPAPAAQFLAQVYPNAATRLAKPGAGDGDLLTTTRAVGENWGAAAPQVALDWFKKQEPQNLVAVQSVILGWWKKDAKAAAAYLSAHVSTPNEREVAGMMSGTMAGRDPRPAAQWVEWVKEERLRRRLRLGIAQVWTMQDAKAAGEWSKNLIGKEGEEAIGVVAGVWAFKDSASAEKWIGSLHGRTRDVAIRGYATTMARTNQKSALDWVLKMEDRQGRKRLVRAIAADWIKQNPDESKAWIKKSKLSEAEKKELLKTSLDAD
jgi:hypothetical protein